MAYLLLLLFDRFTKILSINKILPFYANQSLFFFNFPQLSLIVISVIILIILSLQLFKLKGKPTFNYLLLIIIGGLSNLFDRLFHGFVIDWLPTPISILNLADIYITFGCLLLIYATIFNK